MFKLIYGVFTPKVLTCENTLKKLHDIRKVIFDYLLLLQISMESL